MDYQPANTDQGRAECLLVRLGMELYEPAAFPVPLPTSASLSMQAAYGRPVFGVKAANSECAYRRSVLDYLDACILPELMNRVSPGRQRTFRYRFNALAALYNYIEAEPSARTQRLAEWSRVNHVTMQARVWSEGQQAAMTAIHEGVRCADANAI